jgi:cytochrome c-type biogenesis protein
VEKEGIVAFLEDKKYTFPTLLDETGEVLKYNKISAFPTTFMIIN